MRIAIAQINPTLGDFENNAKKIIDYTHQALSKKCDLVIFPECAIFGYHPFDMLERKKLVEQQSKWCEKIYKEIPKGIAIIFGLITSNKAKKGKPYYNSAVFYSKGKKPKYFHKQLLPTGDVFDEGRFIEAGDLNKNFFNHNGKKFYLTICEDIWGWPDTKGNSPYKLNPLSKVAKKPVDLVINLSASPYHIGKMKKREHMTLQTAKHFKAPMVYVNLVGAQDEIIYDGASYVIDKKGTKKVTCRSFEEDLNVFDLNTLEPWAESKKRTTTEELHSALVLGIRDFCTKVGIQKVHLGLSGGIDSALVAALAVDALGPSSVTGIALPGPFNASESYDLAKKLAKNLGIDFLEIGIEKMFATVQAELNKALDIKQFGLVHENMQARIRGLTLMALSNARGSMLLTTGNKSEYATGYATLYGDMCGGLAPIGDLTKKQVVQLCEYYNSQDEIIPTRIITRPPSAELRPDQKDQDSLPTYDLLDAAVVNLVEKNNEAKSQTEKWLLPMIMRTEFKRWQAPPILKISEHSFGRGRRYPIAHRGKE